MAKTAIVKLNKELSDELQPYLNGCTRKYLVEQLIRAYIDGVKVEHGNIEQEGS